MPPDSTEKLSFNNTFCRCASTIVSLKVARWFNTPKSMSRCHPISKKLIVKTGFSVHLTEAATLQFVSKNTSIPVPRVQCSFVFRNRTYIVMDRIKGDPISNVWLKLTEADRDSILLQLRHMLQELRAIAPPPGTGVESCVGGSLRDPRMTRSSPRFGPFKTIEDFHYWLRGGLQLKDFPSGFPDCDEQDWDDFKEMAIRQDTPWPSPVFTHADLNPSNILVRGGQVVGIVDWEVAGWYPSYWEFTSACYLQIPDWDATVPKFLDPFPNELKMERTRQRWWGEI
ncbi:kinase-like protein [Annulohypoxylon maeteangense]|uniref:kinase-like protein n=1 Tax=Annulohypoxylon maeteangense TaxID=1927788 RepID=UPI002008A203|nr:kinase-like protein [Annulohypoxylon maeteangense]KAI0882914.1 kinase-like protein [Annulohypoxylon maeteangense]